MVYEHFHNNTARVLLAEIWNAYCSVDVITIPLHASNPLLRGKVLSLSCDIDQASYQWEH